MSYTGTCRACGHRGSLQIMGEDGTGLCKSCFYDGSNELTASEAERSFQDAPAAPCDPEEIERIVDHITSANVGYVRPNDADGNPVVLGNWYWAKDRRGDIVGAGKFLA